MMSEHAIALYLGESYASIGVFELNNPLNSSFLFDKSVFLPQVSLKNILAQSKAVLENKPIKKVFIVTRYFDRLKNFRLGGSVAQVVVSGFENCYSMIQSKDLSLAAASLVISVTDETITDEFLKSELERIKKINPDTSKMVLQLPESKISQKNKKHIYDFFTTAGFKIFTCDRAEDLGEIRKTLLNAGCEGTKEEVLTDLKEIYGEELEIFFWTQNQFKKEFENYELFNSSNDFLSAQIKKQKLDFAVYLDHEVFKLIGVEKNPSWESPWGSIPMNCTNSKDFSIHPFSEIKLDHLSMLNLSETPMQYEPGPVLAGRGIKPLAIDLFYDELADNLFMKSTFTHFNLETLKLKMQNQFSVLEKSQLRNSFSLTKNELKSILINRLKTEISLNCQESSVLVCGPLYSLLNSLNDQKGFQLSSQFHWPTLIQQASV